MYSIKNPSDREYLGSACRGTHVSSRQCRPFSACEAFRTRTRLGQISSFLQTNAASRTGRAGRLVRRPALRRPRALGTRVAGNRLLRVFQTEVVKHARNLTRTAAVGAGRANLLPE